MKKALLILCMALSAGCLSEEDPETLDGTYTLRSVNGKALPFTLSENAGTKIELLDEAYKIDQTLNFVRSAHVRTTVNGQPTTAQQSNFGTVGSEGHFLKFRSTGLPEVVAEYETETLTVVAAGATFFYSK